ncbi:uncharacterized protein [Clytia hemisphaerica]|uniref:DUF7164 domain-containing protein n=1 Tax=Clytia hemisphaerica TaxID=252671 RepID=A0A7M5USL6_9CNID|eukprot:TCONS_00029868-protein
MMVKFDRWKALIPIAFFLYVILWCFLHLEEGSKVTSKYEDDLDSIEQPGEDVIKHENALWGGSEILHPKHIRSSGGHKRLKAAVVVFLPKNINFVNQFVTMLYGSWRYVYENNFDSEMNLVDLVVFAHQTVLDALPGDCKIFYTSSGVPKDTNQCACWKIEQKNETPSAYKNLNSYVMFLRSDINVILQRYTYALRTDMDVFLTPKFFKYRPTLRVVTGIGQYCHEFNRGRLKAIAKQHGLKHRGIHCIGSSWYGYMKDITKLSIAAYNMSLYLYDYEFKDGLPGLENINFRISPNGKWPEWYKLTSTMYGSEIVLNDGVPNFSMQNMQRFDVSTCNPWKISEHYQLHAYHTECEFNKKRFLNQLTELAIGTSTNRLSLEHKLRIYERKVVKDIESLNTTEYSTFIAWRSAAKYLEFRLKI